MQTAVLILDGENPRITAEEFAAQYQNDWGTEVRITRASDSIEVRPAGARPTEAEAVPPEAVPPEAVPPEDEAHPPEAVPPVDEAHLPEGDAHPPEGEPHPPEGEPHLPEGEAPAAEEHGFRVEADGGLLEVVQSSVPCAAAAEFAEWEDLGAMWPRERTFNAAHPAHVSVACGSTGLDVKQASHLVTQALASLVALVDSAHAIVWPTARHPIEPSLLRKIALDPRVEGRVPLWVSVEIVKAVDGSPVGRTEGMVEFGHPEFEVAEADESAADLVTFLLRLASFSVSRGAIPPGQTVASPSGPRRIIVGDSMFADDAIVHRILPARLSRDLPRDPDGLGPREPRGTASAHGSAAPRGSAAPHPSASPQRAAPSPRSAAPKRRGFWARFFGG